MLLVISGITACAQTSIAPIAPIGPIATEAPVGRGLTASAVSTVSNSLGMSLVRIPAGEFMMGSDESIASLEKDFPLMERQRLEELFDEAPVHRVRITKDFFLGQTEVTVGQFRQFLKTSGYVPESIADGTGGYGYNAQHIAKGARGEQFDGRNVRYSWSDPGFAQGDDHPVVNVSWNDAQAMAQWLSKTEHRKYRLPTEAEWEYAARAGTRTRYHNGDDPQGLAQVANTFDARAAPFWSGFARHATKGDDGYAFTAPVAAFAPNAFGLHDMHGNVWEWTNDLQGPSKGSVYVRKRAG